MHHETEKQYKHFKRKLGLKGETKPGDLMKRAEEVKEGKVMLKKHKKAHKTMACKVCGSKAHKVHPKAEKHYKKHKNFIAKAIKHPGALHRELGVKQGNKIPKAKLAAAAKKPGVEGRRARFAETLSHLRKG